MTIHNLSTHTFNKDKLHLLEKGLSFAVSPQTTVQERQLQLLNHYDEFTTSIRSSLEFARPHSEPSCLKITPGRIYKAIKFLPREKTMHMEDKFSGIGRIEQGTKQMINENCQQILKQNTSNITKTEFMALKQLIKRSRSQLTIKLADKNLGIVLLDTDYIKQCMLILSDTRTYRQAHTYPTERIRQQLTNTLVNFKSQIYNYDKRLYEYLQRKLSTKFHNFMAYQKYISSSTISLHLDQSSLIVILYLIPQHVF